MIYALAAVGESVVESIVDVFDTDNVFARKVFVKVLAKIRNDRAIEVLTEIAKSDEDYYVRRAATDGLDNAGDRSRLYMPRPYQSARERQDRRARRREMRERYRERPQYGDPNRPFGRRSR